VSAGRQNSYRAFSLYEVQIFARQLLQTVSFLHGMELIHTDLKLENILFVNSDWQYHRHPKHGRSRVVKQKDIVVIDLGSATYEQVISVFVMIQLQHMLKLDIS
jgi:dual-specificity kinase